MSAGSGRLGVPPRDSPRSATFPTGYYERATSYYEDYAAEISRGLASLERDRLEHAAAILLEAYLGRARVFSCGNGGSAAIANHLQCDHLKGIRTRTDLVPRVMSLSSNVELLTAIGNDISFADVFCFQLQSEASANDVLVAISASGRSPNVVKALRWAGEHGVQTIALTGFDGGEARELADVAIHVDSSNYGVIEDLHQSVMHVLAQFIRQSRMNDAEVAATGF